MRRVELSGSLFACCSLILFFVAARMANKAKGTLMDSTMLEALKARRADLLMQRRIIQQQIKNERRKRKRLLAKASRLTLEELRALLRALA